MAVTRNTLRLQDRIDDLMRTITDRMQRDLQVAWASAWDEVRADLVMAVADALAGGGRVTMTQMRQNRRLTRVLQMVLDRLEALVDSTQVGVIAQMRSLVDSAVAAQASIVDSQLPPGFDLTPVGRWSRVDIRQVDAMVTRTTQRIHSQSRPLAAQAVTAMKRELIRGISVGSNPRVTARRIVDRAGDVGFGGGLARAMVIARTETLDAYREGARIGQAPHADVLDGWEWLATLSPRTCPACLSMHGREFPLSTPGPQGHQQCRCTRLPVVKAWDDLGIDGVDEPDDVFPSADEYFESLTPAERQAMLGKRGYQAWLAGDWDRDQWAVKRESDGWRDSWVNAKPPALAAGGGGVKVPPPNGPVPGVFDGPGAPKPGRVTRAVDPATGKVVKLQEHEIVTGYRIASLGVDVAFQVNPHERTSADALILGATWEIKAPPGAGRHVIAGNLAKAQTQADRAILDLYRSGLPAEEASAQIAAWLANPRNRLAALWVLPNNVSEHWKWER